MKGDWTTKQNLATVAYERLRRDILRCDLEPGQRVTKVQLGERYGMGQSAIRDALARLCQEGLVQVIPREAFVVAPATLRQLQELFDARLVIEPVVARLAAGRVDGDELRRLDAAYIDQLGAADRDTIEARVHANTAFHLAIARAAGNARLVQIIAALYDELERYLNLGYTLGEQRHLTPPTSHQEVIDALVAGHGERAEAITTEQIRHGQTFILSALLGSPGIQTVNLASSTAGNSSSRLTAATIA